MKEKSKEYIWKTSNGLKLHGFSLSPSNSSPRAVIMILHGLGEHLGRYAEWIDYFSENNFAVTGIDLRGHGRSEGKRGYVKQYEDLIQDLVTLIKNTDRLYKGIPKILYGHSLGGNLAIYYKIRQNHYLSGLIAASPWIRLAFPPSRIKILAGKIIKSLIPKITFSSTISPEHLTHNKEKIKSIYDDPLGHDSISPNLFLGAKQAGKYILHNRHKINVPFLLMHGNKDKIASSHASRKFVRHTGNHTELKIWKGCYHELHNEINNREILDFVINWLGKNGF
jgi:alpha-beta hydrolase superfamily lysophospholipase